MPPTRIGQPAPVGQGGGVGQEDQIAPGHESGGQASLVDLDRPLGGERGVADGAESADIEHLVLAQARAPNREIARPWPPHRQPRLQLDRVPLAVVEADGLHPLVARQRPGQADRGVLAAGEQHQGACVGESRHAAGFYTRRPQCAGIAGSAPPRLGKADGRSLCAALALPTIARTAHRSPHGRAVHFPDAGPDQDLSRRQEGVREHLAVASTPTPRSAWSASTARASRPC